MLHGALGLTPRLLINRLRYGRYPDILLTHAPPLGIHNGPDLAASWFRALLTFTGSLRAALPDPRPYPSLLRVQRVTETRYKRTMVLNTAGYRLLTIDAPAHGRRDADG